MATRFENFDTRFRKALEYWGKGQFPDVFREHADYRTKDLSSEEMQELCLMLIENCERVPSLARVLVFASAIRNRRQVAKAYSARCGYCEGDGYVSAWKKPGERYSFSFRCPNENCNIAPNSTTPRWSKYFETDYTLRIYGDTK